MEEPATLECIQFGSATLDHEGWIPAIFQSNGVPPRFLVRSKGRCRWVFGRGLIRRRRRVVRKFYGLTFTSRLSSSNRLNPGLRSGTCVGRVLDLMNAALLDFRQLTGG